MAESSYKLFSRRTLLILLIVCGVASSLFYFSWWLTDQRYMEPMTVMLFLISAFYVTAQVYCVWFIYLQARHPADTGKKTPAGLTVDVFIPTFNEPSHIIEKAIRAALRIRHPHETYVLDDGNDSRVRSIAQSVGARYLARTENVDYKAGNINFALERSTGEFIVVFDVDHVPEPDFIEKVLPYFSEPDIGVVQVALDHYNTNESFVARASTEMNDDFFAATMLGMDGCGAASVFGSNSVFRRDALRGMGGYKPGLAEDLNTSLHLHAAGWKSAYAPKLLAKGLVPSDLVAFAAQQYKWARGVFDVLFQVFPKLAGKLTWEQRICYLARMTYYLAGPMVALHLLFLLVLPLLRNGSYNLMDYLHHLTPFVAFFVLTHIVANDMYAIKPPPSPLKWKGILLALGSWPIYVAALVASLTRSSASYIPTPKTRTTRSQIRLIIPQVLFFILFVCSLLWAETQGQGWSPILYGLILVLLILVHLGVFCAVAQPKQVPRA